MLLAVIVVGATTVGAWLGDRSQTVSPASAGPSLAELTAQVKKAVTGTAANEFGVADVTTVVCGRPNSWNPGVRFRCQVYGPSHQELGVYDGTVGPTTSAGYWQWNGSWNPSHRSSSTD